MRITYLKCHCIQYRIILYVIIRETVYKIFALTKQNSIYIYGQRAYIVVKPMDIWIQYFEKSANSRRAGSHNLGPSTANIH